LHKTGDSARQELSQSKALAYQDFQSTPRARPPTPTPSRCGRLGRAVAKDHSSPTASRTLLSSTAQLITGPAKRMSVGTNLPSAKPPYPSGREIECQQKP
jgi:hypothetical protein